MLSPSISAYASIQPAPSHRSLVLKATGYIAGRELESIMALRSQIHLESARQHDRLRSRAIDGDDPDYLDHLSDLAAEIDELLGLGEQMLVVALYRIVELSTIRILGWRYGPETVKKKQLYRADVFERTLKEGGIDVHALPGFTGINELRCLNNAVKHEGKVDSSLAQFPNWIEGEDLGDCSTAIERLSRLVAPYVTALADAAIPK